MSDMNSLSFLRGVTGRGVLTSAHSHQCLTMLILPSGSLSIEVARLTSSISSPPKQMTT